jgi:hypothetical protein
VADGDRGRLKAGQASQTHHDGPRPSQYRREHQEQSPEKTSYDAIHNSHVERNLVGHRLTCLRVARGRFCHAPRGAAEKRRAPTDKMADGTVWRLVCVGI